MRRIRAPSPVSSAELRGHQAEDLGQRHGQLGGKHTGVGSFDYTRRLPAAALWKVQVGFCADAMMGCRANCFSGDEHLTSVSEFAVYKIHKTRHPEPVRRTLCLSETCLLERDPQTYSVCTLRPLAEIFALVRSNDNPQLFSIEYFNGHVRTYTTTDR